jgi:hypothetical protein
MSFLCFYKSRTVSKFLKKIVINRILELEKAKPIKQNLLQKSCMIRFLKEETLGMLCIFFRIAF